MLRSLLFAAGLLCSALVNFASAHSVWIEKLPDGQLCVRFAQWGDDFEKSPGHLDSFTGVSGWTPDEKGNPLLFDVQKKSDQFFLGKGDATKPAFAQLYFTVRKLHEDKPARSPIFYCRWQPEGAGEQKPALTMDIVPTAKPGVAKIFFRGKPLPNVELELFMPGGDDKKLKSDAEGVVDCGDVSKAGPYILTIARYSEELPGFFNGVPFAVTSHSACLSWVQK